MWLSGSLLLLGPSFLLLLVALPVGWRYSRREGGERVYLLEDYLLLSSSTSSHVQVTNFEEARSTTNVSKGQAMPISNLLWLLLVPLIWRATGPLCKKEKGGG